MQPKQEELFTFTSATSQLDPQYGSQWRLLLVDNESNVHLTVDDILRDQQIRGRTLVTHHANSIQEAQRLLSEKPEYTCILLKIGIQNHHAELNLIRYLRETQQHMATRIILYTDQSSYIPTVAITEHYDIHDYKSTTELTGSSLIQTLTSALRSYEQTTSILQHERRLHQCLESSRQLFCEHTIDSYAHELLKQVCQVLSITCSGLVYAYDRKNNMFTRLAASSAHEQHDFNADILPDRINVAIYSATKMRKHYLKEDCLLLALQPHHAHELYIYLDFTRHFTKLDKHLVELFCASASVGYDNAWLFEKMAEQAFIDNLTQLPNRAGFQKKLTYATHQTLPFTLIHTDVDNFQEINDGLGYPLGNEALKVIANHLCTIFGEQAIYGRLSSDTFCIALFQPLDHAVDFYMQKLQASLESSFNVMGYELPISLTSGIVRFPDHGKDAETLLQNVGIALKHAKKHQRGGYTEFGQEFEQQLQQRLKIAARLRHCVDRDELRLFYQPQICLTNNKIVGAEALVRWVKDGQIISPNEFISTAETSGFIVPMGYWILEEACHQQVQWQHTLNLKLKVAVNVSIRQLRDPAFIHRLDEILVRTGIDARYLELEVTESMMMENSRDLRKMLLLVRQRGIAIALDDFGTGYSSLSHLQELPIDLLKIDRSFISKITQSEEDQAIASLMIQTGALLKLRVIAEGVEESYQHQALVQLGCHEAQGYYYNRPLNQAAFTELLTQH